MVSCDKIGKEKRKNWSKRILSDFLYLVVIQLANLHDFVPFLSHLTQTAIPDGVSNNNNSNVVFMFLVNDGASPDNYIDF